MIIFGVTNIDFTLTSRLVVNNSTLRLQNFETGDILNGIVVLTIVLQNWCSINCVIAW